jgi:hypothetical protein
MEHIPAGAPRIAVMNEAHRVLKPGAVFEVIVPFMTGTWHAIADPTHLSLWCEESFHYFDGTKAADADYGIRLWTTNWTWPAVGRPLKGHRDERRALSRALWDNYTKPEERFIDAFAHELAETIRDRRDDRCGESTAAAARWYS